MSSIEEDISSDCDNDIAEVKTPEKKPIETIEIVDSPDKPASENIQNIDTNNFKSNSTRKTSFKSFLEKYLYKGDVSTAANGANTFHQAPEVKSSHIPLGSGYVNEVPVYSNAPLENATMEDPDKPFDTRYISGVKVDFPVSPYAAQLALMSMVIKGINLEQNCLLESPTGSGKTLALLCASLAWQKKEKERIQKLREDDLRPIINQRHQYNCCNSPQKFPGSPKKYQEPNKAPSAVPVSSPSKVAKKPKKSVYYESDDDDDAFQQSSWNQNRGDNILEDSGHPSSEYVVAIHKRHKMSSSPDMSSSGKHGYSSPVKSHPNVTNASPCKAQNNMDSDEIDLNRYIVPKIYFGTRTHKQLEQVIKELRRTNYTKGLKMSILSSREHTCIMDTNSTYRTKNEMCKYLLDKTKHKVDKQETTSGCKHLDNKNMLTGRKAPPGVWDIEDLVGLGQERGACPYFAARDLAAYADIVFCPYNYLLDPTIRSLTKLSLDGNIVIIDEGHNIEDVCRDTASLTLELSQVEAALLDLEAILQKKPTHPDDNDAVFYYLKKYFTNWGDWFQNHNPLLKKQYNFESSYLMAGADLADSLKRHSIGYDTFEELKIKVASVLQDIQESKEGGNATKRYVSAPTGMLLESIMLIFEFFFRNKCGNLDDYKGVLTKKTDWEYKKNQSQSGGWMGKNMRKDMEESVKMTLKISCMNSALVFDYVSLKSRCVILASGTLTPTLSFPAELGTTFPLTLHTAHVISPNQVWVGSVDSGPNGVPLEGTFRNTSKPEWQDALGELLLWVCQTVPHGVLCFLSSYRLMETLQERWQSTRIWYKIEQEKTIFSESRKMGEHDRIMTDYYQCVGQGGAILFAVFRGKVSEGMDFRDHQARAVVTVGIPYPNVRDDIVDGKMKYNESHRADRLLVSGREWLNIQAYRALNQALGRCIRHKNDWGAVIMVDSRFQAPSYTLHISKWVRNFLGDKHHSWDSLTRGPHSLVKFMDNMKLTQPDTAINDM